jgi:hypothetical protein
VGEHQAIARPMRRAMKESPKRRIARAGKRFERSINLLAPPSPHAGA